jgi:predicted signal transduction protein with EAL and GGDEF domain
VGALQGLKELGISDSECEALLAELPALVLDSASGFDRDIGPQPELKALSADAHRALVALNVEYERLVRRLESLISEKEQLTEQLQSANARLAELAATDALTSLPNKRAFDEALTREVARAQRHGTPLSLVMIDVDHFKKVNDTWGHPAGDDARALSTGQALSACR